MSDLVFFFLNSMAAQPINFLPSVDQHNIAFCKEGAGGIPSGRGADTRNSVKQDFGGRFGVLKMIDISQ